jgi:hypothetical protein
VTLIRRPVVAILRGDTAFAGLVAQYLGQPAIFADSLAPADATMPYVVVRPLVAVPRNTLKERGRSDTIDVHAFINAGQGDTKLDDIEERVRVLFDEPSSLPEVPGYRVYSISVAAAQPGAYEPGVTSRVITLEALLQRI